MPLLVIDPLRVPGGRYLERIESLFDAVIASGVERLPAELRYLRREAVVARRHHSERPRLVDPPRAACLTLPT
jgi:hypothetical protein